FKEKDKSAYEAYKDEKKQREDAIRRAVAKEVRTQALAQQVEPMPEGLEQRFRQLRRLYWNARQEYADYLARHDPELWRLLMPCDPVITVAPHVLFFECFSADESSYGCLRVDPAAFSAEQGARLGPPNLHSSWGLSEHFP